MRSLSADRDAILRRFVQTLTGAATTSRPTKHFFHSTLRELPLLSEQKLTHDRPQIATVKYDFRALCTPRGLVSLCKNQTDELSRPKGSRNERVELKRIKRRSVRGLCSDDQNPCLSRRRLLTRQFHHLDQNVPSLYRSLHLPHKCDAGAAHAIRSLQAHVKPQPIDRRHRRFL